MIGSSAFCSIEHFPRCRWSLYGWPVPIRITSAGLSFAGRLCSRSARPLAHWIGSDDVTVLLYGSSQTHLGTQMPSGGGHIIRASSAPRGALSGYSEVRLISFRHSGSTAVALRRRGRWASVGQPHVAREPGITAQLGAAPCNPARCPPALEQLDNPRSRAGRRGLWSMCGHCLSPCRVAERLRSCFLKST